MKHKRSKPYRIRKKKSLLKKKGFLITIFLFVIFLNAVYFLFFSQIFNIKNIVISGNERVKKEEILSVVASNLSKRFLLFQTKSIFLADISSIYKSIHKNFLKVSDIKISRKLPDTIVISLSERTAISLFCQNDKCFSLDKQGVIFEENNLLRGLLKIVDKRGGKEFGLGEAALSRNEIAGILKFDETLKGDMKVFSLQYEILQDRATVKTKDGFDIYFSLEKDISFQIDKLKALFEKYIPLENRINLQYIELRFGNLANYKMK